MRLCSGNSQRRARPLLGTLVEILGGGIPNKNLHEAISKAFSVVERIHQLMSFHDPESDISKLNHLAYEKPVVIHPWTYHVLKMATNISVCTQGYFDCTIGACLVRWKYLPRFKQAHKRRIAKASFHDIEFLSRNRIRFKKPLVIDLGGIAKGFAVDRAVQSLKQNGVFWGSVNAGGDLRVFGPKKQTVYLRHPQNPQKLFKLLQVKNAAFATSAIYFSRKRFHQKWISPIVDPKKQAPCMNPVSVSVTAPTCMIADALTKAVMLRKDFGASFLPAFNAHAIVLSSQQPRDIEDKKYAP